MGKAREPLPVKLLMPMLGKHTEAFEVAEKTLIKHLGPIDYHSPRLPFEHTAYYEEEMGDHLERQFLSFEELIDPGDIVDVKTLTNSLEEQWRQEGKRRINLDPGYIAPAKLVLATTKNHGHRLYLGQGIYGEVTLMYRDNDFRPLFWTYPDYRTEAYREIMRTIREIYMAQIRALRASGAIIRRSN